MILGELCGKVWQDSITDKLYHSLCGVKKGLFKMTSPFKAFFAAIIDLKVYIKKSECKANHKHQWSKVFQLHFSLIINYNKSMVTAVLIVGNIFSTVTWKVKCTTGNGVHMCFHGWQRCRAEGVCEKQFYYAKRSWKPIKKEKRKFIDWYVFPIIMVMLIVSRAFVTSVFFSCVRCSAASHATRGQRTAVTSQGDPL